MQSKSINKANMPTVGPSRGPGRGPVRGYVSKPKEFKKTMKRLLVYLRPFYPQIMTAAVLSIIAAILSVLAPWLLGLITSEISDAFEARRVLGNIHLPFNMSVSIIQLSILIVSIYVFSGIFNYLQSFLLVGMTQHLAYQMRKDLARKINRLPLGYFDKHEKGDILSRVTNDVETINQTLSQSAAEIFRAITLVIGILVIMYLLSWILATIVVITTTIALFASRKFVKLSQGYFRKQAQYNGQLNGHIEEAFNGHAIIKIYSHQETSYQNFRKINHDMYDSSLKSQFISGIMMPVQFFIGNLAYILIILVGAFLVVSDNVSIAIKIGLIQTFIQYTRQINQPIQQIGSIANVLQSTAASAERIFMLLDEKEESPERSSLKTLPKVEGHVEFKDVVFSYDGVTPVIDHFSASIKKGQKVAIVGPTGAGKTTIVNLLMRFYEINEGSIMIDDIDIRDLKRQDVRSLFGMVLQDTWLFEGTIYDNIAYGSNKDSEAVYSASKASQVDHFITSLPKGYDFVLSEDGENISQGQRQLITIARAMLADKPMLILDEATSNVDTRTEVLIQKAMQELMKNRTSFVIAHRLSTIKDSDVIFVMQKGNIVEHGSHDELILKGGAYKKLYESQFDDH